MVVVTSTTCPHGLPRATCEICQVLEPTPVRSGAGPARRPGRGGLASVASLVVVAVVGFLVVGWVAAAVFAVLRIVELLAVAVFAGWAGFRLGVHRGRAGG